MAKKTQSQKAAEKEAAANGVAAESTQAPAAEKKDEPKAPGKIEQILNHFKAGKTTKEISQLHVLDAAGNPIPTGEKDKDGNDIFATFHPTTISIQVNKFKKANPDLYPPQPPKPTKKQLAAEAKAKKAAEAPAEAPAADATA